MLVDILSRIFNTAAHTRRPVHGFFKIKCHKQGVGLASRVIRLYASLALGKGSTEMLKC